ncbi:MULTISPECIES: hypothetical protein [unclassified Lactobacillus]|uniref:hypothetical protein n=1 Tax=unclassified Lactobacillus TaxID=2620435 RepID=UPI000BEF0BE6|nr:MULTISPECIES: hypothetical protein [unclassified Lactobacillus]PEG90744.1 hypothetical protein CP363_05015 [Lactobacillus sp. UMNPBX12]PEG92712.1 hypothetical protein CP362_05515 [Lactobacillus sp. UMNPBX11]
MNNDINQDVKQDAPVTDNQTTPVTPVAPAVPDSVKLDLSADQAEMVQDLLSNFVYAYRSDREVDCKRELVRRDQVGKYPYIAEAPDPSIINPIYDWVGKKWYSKSGSTSLPEITQAVKTLQNDQQVGTAQNLALTKAVKELSEGQADQNKLLSSMQHLMLQLASGKVTTPAVPTQPTTDDKTTDNTNGGNN